MYEVELELEYRPNESWTLFVGMTARTRDWIWDDDITIWAGMLFQAGCFETKIKAPALKGLTIYRLIRINNVFLPVSF
jgi:hypothetical protein